MNPWLIAALIVAGAWLLVSAVLMIVAIRNAPRRDDWD